jgi:hypothetical protein
MDHTFDELIDTYAEAFGQEAARSFYECGAKMLARCTEYQRNIFNIVACPRALWYC